MKSDRKSNLATIAEQTKVLQSEKNKEKTLHDFRKEKN